MNMMNQFLHAGIAMAQPTAEGGAQSGAPMWPMFIIMFVLMYFMLIRPQQKKNKEAELMIKGAKTGDQVVAAGGIMGMISNVKENTVILKVADNVKIEVLKSSIVSVTKPGSETSAAS